MVIYGEGPSNDILGMAGELVWVQRGNATWWPGQILDRDELPQGCVPAPKPAVPVILIGRQDATVDWYNLDKSKKVKAFRCREFDDSIEKAKASTFHCSRKAYPREDAILQALELESSTGSNKISSELARTSSAVINNSEGCSKTAHRASSRTKICVTTQSGQSSRVDTISFGNESNSATSSPPDVHSISPRIAQGMPTEWWLKGIRNHRSRNMVGSSQYMDPNRTSGSLIIDMDGNLVKSRSIAEIEMEMAERRTWTRNMHRGECTKRGSTAEMTARQRQLPHHQSRSMLNPKYDSGEFSLSRLVVGSGLHNVPVEVKTDFQPRHVPFISLTSKIDGRAVVGHPLTVDVLDDGSCQYLLDHDPEVIHNSSEASPFHGDDVVHAKGSHGSPPRKQNWPCTKKTRKLSSLMRSEEHTHRTDYKPMVKKIEGPSVTCVPLKVVFSRLNADLKDTIRTPPLVSTK